MTRINRSTFINSILSLVLLMTVSMTAWSDGHGNHHAETKTDAMSLMNAYIANFLKVFNKGDAAEIAALYTEDAIWSVSGLAEPVYGRAAIQAGMESNADGSVDGATLGASVFTSRDLGNGYIMANGSWEQRDANGTRVDGGLWGNLFQVVDGEVLMLLESTNRN
jgi:ketosteroid isomerase-like protein